MGQKTPEFTSKRLLSKKLKYVNPSIKREKIHIQIMSSNDIICDNETTINKTKIIFGDHKEGYRSLQITIMNEDKKLYKSIFTHFTEQIDFVQILYNIINNVQCTPSCEKCGKTLNFINFGKGYNKCSNIDCITERKRSNLDLVLESHKHILYDLLITQTKIRDILNDDMHMEYQSFIKYHPDLINSIFQHTQYLPADSKFTERLYHLYNNLTDRVKCEVCNQEYAHFVCITQGYRSCSSKCGSVDRDPAKMIITKRDANYDLWEQKLKTKNISIISDKKLL